MRGASTVVKMSLMVVAISLAVVQMKIDAFCEHTTGASVTQTHTGVSDGMFGKMFSGTNTKISTIGAIVALSLSYLMTKSTVNAEVTKAPLNYDDVNQTTVRAEAESYLQQQIQLQQDTQQVNNTQVTENIVGKYVSPAVEPTAQWQVQHDDDSVNDHNDEQAHENVEKSETQVQSAKNLKKCNLFEGQMVERFADEILDRVDNSNSTLVLKSKQNDKMQNKLTVLKETCAEVPVEYVGPVEVNGEKTGEHVYTITDMDKLGRMAREYKNPNTIRPSQEQKTPTTISTPQEHKTSTTISTPQEHKIPTSISTSTDVYDDKIISDKNSTSVSNGTTVASKVSTVVSKVTTPTTESAAQPTEDPRCAEFEKTLIRRFANNIVPELAYERTVFQFNQKDNRKLRNDLLKMKDMNCRRIPLKFKSSAYVGSDKEFDHQYTLGDNISINSIKKLLFLQQYRVPLRWTESSQCEAKRHEMATIVEKPLRKALKNNEDAFEVDDRSTRVDMCNLNREMGRLHCDIPLDYEADEDIDEKFSITIINDEFVEKWEADRKAAKKAARKNQRDSTNSLSGETSEELRDSTPRNDEGIIDPQPTSKCENRLNRLLEALESEVDEALNGNKKVVRVDRGKETKIKNLLQKLDDQNCESPLKLKKEELGQLRPSMRLTIRNRDYLQQLTDNLDESEGASAVTAAQQTTTRSPRTESATDIFYKNQANRIVHILSKHVLAAIAAEEDFITLNAEHKGTMDAALATIDDLSIRPFVNGRIESNPSGDKVKYNFNRAYLERKYPEYVGIPASAGFNTKRDLLPLSTQALRAVADENHENRPSNGNKLSTISLDGDLSAPTTQQSTTVNPICEDILDEAVNEFEPHFRKMFKNEKKRLNLGYNQFNSFIVKENKLNRNACPNPFDLHEAEFRRGLRVTFDLDPEFTEDVRKRIMKSEQ